MDTIFRMLEAPLVWLSERRGGQPASTSLYKTDSIGTSLETGAPIAIPPEAMRLHSYILGSTGCGKTTLILKLIEEDLTRNHTVVVVDLRGDLIEGVLSLAARLGLDPSRVTLLDLRERDRVQGFNPLAGAGESFIRALHMLEVFRSESPSWGVQLEETLRSALLMLAENRASLTKLEAVLFDGSFRSEAQKCITDEALLSFWERYDTLSADKQSSWALPVMNKVTPLLSVPVARAVLSWEAPLDLGKLLDSKGTILLVSLAVDELQATSRMMGSLIVSSIAREMMARVKVKESDRNPVRLYVDEFENLASEAFEALIAEGRRFGLSLVLSHQTLTQLPTKLRSVIRNNVGLQVLFQCGFEDAAILARELPDEYDAGRIRSQGVGEAILLRRDGTAEPVRFSKPKAAASSKAREAFREQVLERIPIQTSPLTPTKLNAHPSPPPAQAPWGLEDFS